MAAKMSVQTETQHRPTRVVFVAGDASPQGHDARTKASLAAWLARLLGLQYGGSVEKSAGRLTSTAYAVPCDTLTCAEAQRLGINGPHRLFGGVAPQPFVTTKLITHPLPTPAARSPEGWVPQFAPRVAHVVLEGVSAFDPADARRACSQLLAGGTVRLKDAAGVGGSGQAVVANLEQFDGLLASEDFAQAARSGLVLERNLRSAQTISVGQVHVDGWLLSYHGQQRLTRNSFGKEVYGGSTLHFVCGDFDALLADDLPANRRLAIEQARTYHDAAFASFSGLMASRSNYDVVQGTDDLGVWRSGVLEQSWRIGGASGAEIAAMQLFRARPSLRWVRASTHEVHAAAAEPPSGAELHYDGPDAHGGRLLKYTTVDGHGDD
jgi:hypothetical protein